MRRLRPNFCSAPVVEVARGLLGKLIQHKEVLVRITEVEAYAGSKDSASHARFGLTSRNAVMFGPPGHAYVYLCYGIHHMLNVVAEAEGRGAAVLIRSVELVSGVELVEQRRRQSPSPKWLAGPGKVAEALGLNRSHNGIPMLSPSELGLFDDGRVPRLVAGARVGIDYAKRPDRTRRWRFADANSASVTFERKLTPNRGSR